MSDGRNRTGKFTHIGEILQQTLRSCRRETNETLARIGACWPEVAGESLGPYSSPAAMKGKVLLVHVASPVWLHEMRFLKADMIGRINRLGETPLVRDIKFKVGPV